MSKTVIAQTAAAYLFVQHPDASAAELAEMLKTSERTLYRYAKTPAWQATLHLLGYDGDPTLRKKKARDVQRDTPEFNTAHTIYAEARTAGDSPAKAARTAEAETGIPRKRIREWSRRYQWESRC